MRVRVLPLARRADRPDGRIWPAVLACVGASTVAATALLVAAGLAPRAPLPFGRPLPLSTAAIVGALVLSAACWLVVGLHPLAAVGLSLVAVAWMLPALAAWALPSAQVRAGLLAATPLAVAGIALVTASWRPGRIGWGVSLLTTIGLAIAAASAHLFGYNPFFDPACRDTCEASPAILSDVLGARNALAVSVGFTLAAVLAATITCIRNGAAPLMLRASAIGAAMLMGAAAVEQWWRWGHAATPATADRLQALGTAVIASAVLVVVMRTRAVRRDVRDVVAQLAGSAPVASATGAVTAIHFAVAPDRRWVDADGHEARGEEPTRRVVLAGADGLSVRLTLGRWAEPDQVLAAITPAGLLMLENALLSVAGRVRLVDVRASQRRIVEATDRERRSIERNLHDGAQQRLVAVAMHLSSGRQRSCGAGWEELGAAEASVRGALAALRALSHDSLGEVLSTEGLAVAIEELLAARSLRASVEVALGERPLPGPVETAAYLTVAAGIDNVAAHAHADRASIAVVQQRDELLVRIRDNGRGGAVVGAGLTDVADRVGALGGSLELTSDLGSGTELTVRLPCAS